MKPFIKLFGGKRRLAPYILARMPRTIGTYVEPFIGGGAIFAALADARRFAPGARTILGDLDPALVDLYRLVRAHGRGVAWLLAAGYRTAYAADPQRFHGYVRTHYNCSARRSGLTRLFLSRTSFNGLYRENRAGAMNVPWNQTATLKLPSPHNLDAWYTALARASLVCGSWEQTVSQALRAISTADAPTVVYADPPYVGGFVNYKGGGFTVLDTEYLVEYLADLSASWHTTCVLSLPGAAEPIVRQFWPEARVERLMVARPGNRDGAGRGKVPEILASSPGLERC